MSKQSGPNCRARIDPELWRWAKYKAIREERPLRELVEEIFREAKRLDENRNALDWRQPDENILTHIMDQSRFSRWSITPDEARALSGVRASEQEDKS